MVTLWFACGEVIFFPFPQWIAPTANILMSLALKAAKGLDGVSWDMEAPFEQLLCHCPHSGQDG
jgi:hypothetical protein